MKSAGKAYLAERKCPSHLSLDPLTVTMHLLPGWPPQPHTHLAALFGRAAEHQVAWAGRRLKLGGAAWLASSSAVHTTQAAFPRGLEQ